MWKGRLAQRCVDHSRKLEDSVDAAKRYAPSGDHASSDVADRSAKAPHWLLAQRKNRVQDVGYGS